MKYASVIVDVPAKQTDRAFDYKIPEEWQELLIPGMRVIVPFGPRKVQGFVIETKDQSDWNRLKPIAEIVDLTPCLTPELLELGQWLTEKTLCFKISAFQAMLPAAMKAKYEKVLRLLTNDLKNLTEILQPFFQKNDQVKLTDIEQTVPLRIIQKEIEKSYLEVIYNVKQKTNKKTVKVIKRNQSFLQLTELVKQFPANARKQLDVINYFISNQINEIPLHDLLIEANSSYASVKALIKKEIIVEEIKEVYRDPYQDRDFKKTNALLLNNEQQQAIAPILDSIRETFHDVFLLY
jgi:primosomal protein N' (replication factor Y)